jgi:hypothetical protein
MGDLRADRSRRHLDRGGGEASDLTPLGQFLFILMMVGGAIFFLMIAHHLTDE